jgi:predicted metal-dependent peptidase
MHDRLLERALAEVEAILARAGLRQKRVRVLAVDTTAHAVQRVSHARQITLAGGGGTDMGAGIAAANALRPRPPVVIVLTDGYTPWPHRRPRGSKVVVGLLGEPGAPTPQVPTWARTVLIEDASPPV